MTRPSPLRAALLIALLCAVSLRLLTPPGWMPNVDGRAGGPLVICTVDGAQVLHSAADPVSHHPAGKTAHEPCVFAGLALDSARQATAFLAPLPLPRTAPTRLPPNQAQFAPTWRRPQAPRAPPLFA